MWTLAEVAKGACKMCCCVWCPLLGLWQLRKHCPSRRFSCADASGPGRREASADRRARPRHGSIAGQDLPHRRQPGSVLEQRPQIGDQTCFVCMRDNQNYTSHHWKLGDSRWYWGSRPLQRSGCLCPYWLVAAFFRWGLRCPACHSPQRSPVSK